LRQQTKPRPCLQGQALENLLLIYNNSTQVDYHSLSSSHDSLSPCRMNHKVHIHQDEKRKEGML
jgi:hypothetical protein